MDIFAQHGGLVKQMESMLYSKAFCADGVILRDDGEGWRSWRRLKGAYTVEDGIRLAEARVEKRRVHEPRWFEFRSVMLEVAPSITERMKLFNVLNALSDDPDGLYTAIQDEGASLEIDQQDAEDLCTKFEAYRAERAERNSLLVSVEPSAQPEIPDAPTNKV